MDTFDPSVDGRHIDLTAASKRSQITEIIGTRDLVLTLTKAGICIAYEIRQSYIHIVYPCV